MQDTVKDAAQDAGTATERQQPGLQKAPDLENLPNRNTDDQESLRKGTAQLRITRLESPDDKPRFGLEARCCASCAEVKYFTYGRPNIAINDNIAVKGPPPGEYLDELRIWSSGKGELTRWLYDRRERHGDLNLLIWDDTDYRIPWELLWLPAWPGKPGPEPGFLGAVLTVSRWVHTHAPFPEIMQDPTNPPLDRASGPVAAYIAPEMVLDETLLTDFIVESAGDMEELFAKLAAQPGVPEALAMVYVACHGTFDSNPKECRLDGTFTYGRAIQFDDNLGRLRERPTLVFLNSCVSGLAGIDVGKYNDGALRGFAEVFLRFGAAGVLATTGAIGKDEARELADHLFRNLKADSELPVAAAVRELRYRALNEMNRNPQWFKTGLTADERNAADLNLLPLLYPFMYIYFGSPWLLLSPTRRQRSARPGGPEPAGTRS